MEKTVEKKQGLSSKINPWKGIQARAQSRPDHAFSQWRSLIIRQLMFFDLIQLVNPRILRPYKCEIFGWEMRSWRQKLRPRGGGDPHINLDCLGRIIVDARAFCRRKNGPSLISF